MEIKKYITENEFKMLEGFSLIRIPSISAKPEYHDDMLACAKRWAQLSKPEQTKLSVMPSKGNPIVFGQKMVRPGRQDRIGICPLRRDAGRASRTLEKRPL